MSENEVLIPIQAHITDTTTGETQVYHMMAEPGGIEYEWGEGNSACDCCRHSLFIHAGGKSEPEKLACGTERFRVKVLSSEGAVLYEDDA